MGALLACAGSERASTARVDSAAPVAVEPAPPVAITPVVDSVPTAPDAVGTLLRFVDAQPAADTSRAAAAVVGEGIALLAAAVETLARRDSALTPAADARLGSLRALGDSVVAAPDSLEQARLASEALQQVGEMLQALQDRGQPGLIDRAAEVRAAASALRRDQGLDGQRDALGRFLRRASATVRAAVGATTGPIATP